MSLRATLRVPAAVRLLTTGLLATGLLATACGAPEPDEVDTEAVVPVTVEAARIGNIRGVVRAPGLVTPAPGAELLVIAPEPARIAELPKGEGDPVRRGDLLVRFEIPSRTAEVARQQAEVARAEARIDNATAAKTRAHDLFERGVAARKEMEDADRELADAGADLATAAADLAAARSVAGRSEVRAAGDGFIARRWHNPGDLVDGSAGDPVLRVVDLRRLEVTASVPIADGPRIRVGAEARLTGRGETGAPSLRVVAGPTAVDPATAAVPVRLAFDAPPALSPGTPVEVEIEAEEHLGVVLVPAAAVVRDGGSEAVLVAVGDQAERRAIEVGLADAADVEVESGVAPGDLVITSGQAGLPDGAEISVGPVAP
jgi:RND family efflux transporter MFP subunit